MSAKNIGVLAGVLLAAGALLSCSGEADEPVSDPLAGTWQTSDVFMTFDSGEYTVAQGSATDTPFEGGTYEVDGTTVTLTPSPPTADIETTGLACSVGQVGVYEMTVSDDGSEIRLKVVSDDCADRRNDLSANSLKEAGDDATGPSVPASNAAVFDFATDSLCTWFTADEMNEIVAAAQQQAGTAFPFQAFTSVVAEYPACDPGSGWRTPGTPGDYPGVPEIPPGHAVWFMLEAMGSDFTPLGRVQPDPLRVEDVNPDYFRGHSLLDDEVEYQARSYQYAWNEDVDGYLRVEGHKDEILYFGLAISDDHEISKMRALGLKPLKELSLAMVNEILERMNWINATE